MPNPSPPVPDTDPSRPPWWARPFAGRSVRLDGRQWGILGLLAVADLFDHYDSALMGMALSQIQTGLQIAEEDVGGLLSFVRIGSILALGLSVAADRIGRRRLLLFTILGFTLATFATAFSRTPGQYAVLQLVARIFITGETLLAVVVLAEELAARDRGWGIGVLGALGSLGHGLAAIAFAFVDVMPYGWRSLYVIGVLPLLALSYFRTRLPETERFERHRASREASQGALSGLRPIAHLVRMYPGRVAVLSLALFPFDFVMGTAYAFMAKTLQEVHGYAPSDVSTLWIVGGAIGIIGNLAAGTFGDRFGRRPVMCLAMTVNAVSLFAFYNTHGFWIPLAWVGSTFTILAVGVLFKALGAELFPTSHRSTASGVRTVVATLGGASGLLLEGPLYEVTGSHALAITWMMPALIVPPLVILFFLPETARQELEHISPER